MSSEASEIPLKVSKENVDSAEAAVPPPPAKPENNGLTESNSRNTTEHTMSNHNGLVEARKGDHLNAVLGQSNAVGDGYWPGSYGGNPTYSGAAPEEYKPAPSASPSFYHPMSCNAMGEPYSTQGAASNMGLPYTQTGPLHGVPVLNSVPVNGSLGAYPPIQDNQTHNRLIGSQQTRNTVMPGIISHPRQRTAQWDRMGGWGNTPSGWRSSSMTSPVSPGWTMSPPAAMVPVNHGAHHNMFSPPKSPMYNSGQSNPAPSQNPQNFYGNSSSSNNYRSQYMNVNGSAKSHSHPDTGYQVHLTQDFQPAINSLSNQFLNMMRPGPDPTFNGQRGFPRNGAAPGVVNGGMSRPFGQRYDRSEIYSRKVFVGGLPPDIDEEEITASFSSFGLVTVDWPHKAESRSYFPPKGYCFLLFHTEPSVQALVEACTPRDGKLYWHVSSPTMQDKAVQIRPWSLSDCDYYVKDASQTLDPRRTIFVGGVPRPLRAAELAAILDNLYGGVCYAGIDTDPELKYPKGAGRVSFSNQPSYIAAINARFVQLQHADIDKRVEVKPYVLDDQICDECQGALCGGKSAPFFCANVACLQYYCDHCWGVIHARPGREYHKPLVKDGASDRPRGVPYRWY